MCIINHLVYLYLSNNIDMFKALRLLYRVSNIEPHQKAISALGIKSRSVIFNPTVPELYEIAFLNEAPSDPHTRTSLVSSNGALCAYSGKKTGREPKNSRVVSDPETEKTVHWDKINIPIDVNSYDLMQSLAISYINHSGKVFIVDGYAGWDPRYRVKVRTFCTRTYHALFMRNMLVRPTERELEQDFLKGVDINIFNAGEMEISKNISGVNSSMITALNLSQKRMVILGTQFAGQMKKSVFKILHYYYPRKNILTLHSSATENSDGSTTLMLGLSSTGKTALGLRSDKRKLIGDDQICWTDDGIFNIEGGSYAKTINLDHELEPQIFQAIKFGTIVENASFFKQSRGLNFHDTSLTPNARAAFPLNYIRNFNGTGMGQHPKNIIFLTCDTKGVLPPVAKLTHQQAIYQFLSGYTAKVGGSDLSSTVPESTFSSCFGEIFLPLNPTIYAEMFAKKIKKHGVNVWLVNTGWTGGKYGVGKRFSFDLSQKILDVINDGTLQNVETHKFKYFNFEVPNTLPDFEESMIYPEKAWNSKIEYEETLSSLAVEFMQNFQKKFKGEISNYDELVSHGPTLDA